LNQKLISFHHQESKIAADKINICNWMPKNGRIYELLENRQLENNVESGEKITKNT
jgi:hypothetical protein